MLGVCAAFIASMDGPVREHTILEIATYLKHNFPSQYAAMTQKKLAYCPREIKDEAVWDKSQIIVEDLAHCRAPIKEEKSNPAMNVLRNYRENALINFDMNYQKQQEELLHSELHFADAAKKLKEPLEEAAKQFRQATHRYQHLQEGYDYFRGRCD